MPSSKLLASSRGSVKLCCRLCRLSYSFLGLESKFQTSLTVLT